MKIIILISLLLFNFSLYSYSLGMGVIAGGGATDIKALESTDECSDNNKDCINDFEYKYKLGINIINKFEVSETIFFKLNLSLIHFKLDFKDGGNSPFLIKTDLALEFYPIKELLEGFYFSSGLFINYFLTEGYSELNNGFSMISAFLSLGYRIDMSKNLSFNGDMSVEIFDIISSETISKAFVGLSGNFYLLYDF